MGDSREIIGDVKAGDTLVLKGNEELKPNEKVAVAFSKRFIYDAADSERTNPNGTLVIVRRCELAW